MNIQFQKFRKSKKKSRKWLAKKSGVGVCTIANFENGKSDIGLNKLIKLCNAIGLDVRFIEITRVDNRYEFNVIGGFLNEKNKE